MSSGTYGVSPVSVRALAQASVQPEDAAMVVLFVSDPSFTALSPSLDQPERERIAIRLAVRHLHRRDDGQDDGGDSQHDQHEEADDDQACRERDERPEDDADLEVERFLRLLLDERRIGDAHDDDRHEDVAENRRRHERDQMADGREGALFAGWSIEIVGHVEPLQVS